MLVDLDKNIVSSGGVNNSMLITGKSGTGKTTLALTQCLEWAKGTDKNEGKVVVIVDYSDSYIPQEIRKYGEDINQYIEYIQLDEIKFSFKDEVSFVNEVAEAIINAFDIKGENQIPLVEDYILKVYEINKYISIDALVELMEYALLYEIKDKETKKILSKIINRMNLYKEINIKFKNKRMEKKQSKIYIIQLTDFRMQSRLILARIIIDLLWREKVCGINMIDSILVDECQHMPLYEGSSVSDMLKEGRRRNLDVIVSTQCISQYDSSKRDVLMQAGMRINLRTTDNEARSVARQIDSENIKETEQMLRKLPRGQAIISGDYMLNGGKEVHNKAIIVDIVRMKG